MKNPPVLRIATALSRRTLTLLATLFLAVVGRVEGGGVYNIYYHPVGASGFDTDTLTFSCTQFASVFEVYRDGVYNSTVNFFQSQTFAEGYSTNWPQDDGNVRHYVVKNAVSSEVVFDEYFISGTCFGCIDQTYGGEATVTSRNIVLDGPTPIAPPPYYKCTDNKSGGDQADCASGNCPGAPMAQYSVHSLLVSLNIQDTPLRYSPARGPAINFTVTYNERETQQLPIFGYSNLGPKWTFGWLSYVVDDPTTQLPTTLVYPPGGGAEIYYFDSGSQTFLPDPQSHALLVRTSTNSYQKRFPDGSVQVFDRSNQPGTQRYPRKLFMTEMIDPAGNHASIDYDAYFRITKITDALGQETLVYYEHPTDLLKITKVADMTNPLSPRFATFDYENGKLKTITDEIGIQSVFGYQSGTDLIESITTPYGTTTFARGGSGTNRWIEATDPLGGKERVEYRDNAPGIAATESSGVVPTGMSAANVSLDVRNTFYWSKKAMAVAPGDYTMAKITHWLLTPDGNATSGIVASEKMPLENRIWYAYEGQSDLNHEGTSANPIRIARVLADSTTQLSQYEYNGFGKTTKETDPAGRVMSYVYDSNQIDLLEIRQTTGVNNELVRQLGDYHLHQPQTDIDASGQPTYFTYNTFGQILTQTNAKGERTTYDYGDGTSVPTGYLASITSPEFNSAFAITRFGYDGFHRVQTVTNDPDGYTVTTDYDNLDRKTLVTYPDSTYEEFHYTQDFRYGETTILDLTASRDRLGRWTYRHYNENRQMDSITDPENRTTLYGWCTCGSLESITDPNWNVTTFNRDIQSRVYQKVFTDSSTIDYLFEGQTTSNTAGATSRLTSATDALGRRTNYAYLADNNIGQVSYTDNSGSQLSPPTPTVSYTYDPNYNRVATMTDGTGQTIYTYYPVIALMTSPTLGVGKLQTIDGPLVSDTISYTYDELGRRIDRVVDESIFQAVDDVMETVAYDSLGRLTTTDNALGLFERSYDGVSPRLLTLTYPSGQTANYAYFSDNEHDRRLQSLGNLDRTNAMLSKFDYTYDAEGQILTLSRQLGTVNSGRWFEYDGAQQLLSTRDAFSLGAATEVDAYVYDDAGNRTSDTKVMYPGQPKEAIIIQHDYTINQLNQIFGYVVTGGPLLTWPRDVTNDDAGNMVDDGEGRTFEWDAANRLRAINYGGDRSEFTYDGLNRRVKIVEKTGSTVTSTKQFVWVGNRIVQERDASNNVTRTYFAEGEAHGNSQVGYTNYYYTRDHLGSVREVTSGSSALQIRYDYDPYGGRTRIYGPSDVDFGYTGHYHHAPSGLNLTLYRAYNPVFGRWLSRDPIGEEGGVNLYGYVENDPVDNTDSLGLETDTIEVTKSDGSWDQSNLGPHMLKHDILNRIIPWIDDGVAVHVTFYNVCPSDHPVLNEKDLEAVPASLGTAWKIGENTARIDIHTRLVVSAAAKYEVGKKRDWQELRRGKLKAKCSKRKCHKWVSPSS